MGALFGLAAVAAIAQTPTVEKIDGILTVEWRRKEIHPKTQAVTFKDGVIAYYGPTTVKAQTLTLYLGEKDRRGFAEGDVVIDDPDGSATARRLEFNWVTRTGLGQDITLATTGLFLSAETLSIKPEGWVLNNVRAAPEPGRRPPFALRARSVNVGPDGRGTAKPATLELFGSKIVSLPSYRFGGKRQEPFLRIPSVSYNNGFGVTWYSQVLADDRSLVAGGFRARRGESTGLKLEATRSFLPRREPEAVAGPRNDLGERFAGGYFDNIQIGGPGEERRQLAYRRSSITLGSEINEAAVARRNRELYSRPIYAVMEQARPFGGVALYSSARWETVRESGDPQVQRVQGTASALFPSWEIFPNLQTHTRFDGQGFFGGQDFGWVQAQFGVIYTVDERFRFGASRFAAREFGEAKYAADRLFSTGGYLLRFDANFGATRFSYLTKYDQERRKWYDNEFAISQIAGSLEPYVGFREFPRSVTFGVRLRVQEVFDRLGRRAAGQPPEPAKTRLPD